MNILASASKKQIRLELSKTLAESLNGLKDNIKKKKLEKNIKKASKILLDGVKISKIKKKPAGKNRPKASSKKENAVAQHEETVS